MLSLPMSRTALDELSMPSRGPVRRMMLSQQANMFYELEDTGSGFAQFATYSNTSFGTTAPIHAPNLTADGLRLIFIAPGAGQPVLYYADRPDIAARFGAAMQITTVETGISIAYLGEDCGALFYTVANNGVIRRTDQAR